MQQLEIVYLDDEANLGEIFCDLFASENVSIRTFTDPEKAIEAIRVNPPDLVFLDFRLPKTNGDEIALLLDPKLPKYLISGEISLKTKYSFLRVFEKPYQIEEMQATILSHLDRKNKQAA